MCDRPVTVAPGFEFNEFANTSLVPVLDGINSGPTCLAFDSKGRLFVGTISGNILIMPDNNDDGVVDAGQVKTFASDVHEPLGLDFRANGDLYCTSNVFHSDVGQVGRILRLRDTNGDDVADDIATILDNLPSGGDHQTDKLKFGPDGLLYIGQGSATDNGTPDPGHAAEGPLNGTFLRINVDSISPQPEVFARGLRNPFGMAFDPVSGALFCTDVGAGELCQTSTCVDTSPNEKLNWVFQGGNYGFPNCWIPSSSNSACAGVTGPLTQFIPHLTPTSIAFYTGPQAQAAGLVNHMLVTPFKRLYSSPDASFVGGDLEQFVLTGSVQAGFQLTRVTGPSIADFGLVDPGDGPVDTAIDPLSGDIYVARIDPISHSVGGCTTEHHNRIYRIHRAGSDSLPFIGPVHPAMIEGPKPSATIAVFGRHIKAGATVLADGNPLVTRRISQLELDADLPGAMTSTSHGFAITVSNPDGTRSNSQTLQVVAEGSLPPVINSLTVTKKSGKVVNQLVAGMKAKKLQLIADGIRFDSGAELLVNGTQLSLIGSSATELIGAFTNDMLASPGTLTIQVKNSTGVLSDPMTLTVVAAQHHSPTQAQRGNSLHTRQ
jgi:glucose/arabinose dehydrogenase